MIQPKKIMATAMPMKPAVILLRSEKASQCQVYVLSKLCRSSARHKRRQSAGLSPNNISSSDVRHSHHGSRQQRAMDNSETGRKSEEKPLPSGWTDV